MAKQTCVSCHVISYIMSCMEILRLFVDLIACCLSLQPLPLPEGDIAWSARVSSPASDLTCSDPASVLAFASGTWQKLKWNSEALKRSSLHQLTQLMFRLQKSKNCSAQEIQPQWLQVRLATMKWLKWLVHIEINQKGLYIMYCTYIISIISNRV